LHATESTIRLLDELLKSICHDTQSSKALLTMIELLETLSGRPNYLTLMVRFPAVRQRVLRLIDRASWASLYLMQHPIVLDELLGDAWLAPVDFEKWANRLATQLASIDTEAALDLLREAHHAQVFRLLAQDIEGLISTEHLSDHLSLLADKVVGLMIQVVWQKIQATPSKRMLKRAQPEFAVIAYGKLGGKELGYASDLDLVFIFDKHDDPEDQAEETYAVLSQRLSGYLSMRTSAGILFDVDTRLRPNGASGLITISMAAFSKYQTSAAWVWEHQALGATFEAQRCELLSRPRDVATLKAEVITMRQKIHQGHPNKTELFDIKHDSGAMIDIEFVVQYLVLAHAHKHSKLLENSGNIALLHVAAEAGLIEASLAHRCADAYRRFRQLQHALRLNDQTNGNAACRVPHSDIAEQRQAVLTLWALVMTSA
jgi:[glutamine synthetase] adenylyltransferase / [glutamine synthetase]-adenylyl-L-tyrosine phosphorylase